jgi:hypothetical protein
VLHKFQPFVEARFKGMTGNWSKKITKYTLGPHVDSLKNVITMLYLPKDLSQVYLGVDLLAERSEFHMPGRATSQLRRLHAAEHHAI